MIFPLECVYQAWRETQGNNLVSYIKNLGSLTSPPPIQSSDTVPSNPQLFPQQIQPPGVKSHHPWGYAKARMAKHAFYTESPRRHVPTLFSGTATLNGGNS